MATPAGTLIQFCDVDKERWKPDLRAGCLDVCGKKRARRSRPAFAHRIVTKEFPFDGPGGGGDVGG